MRSYVGQFAGDNSASRSFIRAAGPSGGEALDHVLDFSAPPALGKTTPCGGAHHRAVSAATYCANLRPRAERPGISRLCSQPAGPRCAVRSMKSHRLHAGGWKRCSSGDGGLPSRPHDRRGPAARSHQAEHSAVHAGGGATTRAGLLTSPSSRPASANRARLEFYGSGPGAIVKRSAAILGVPSMKGGTAHAQALARRTPASPIACCGACATMRRSSPTAHR